MKSLRRSLTLGLFLGLLGLSAGVSMAQAPAANEGSVTDDWLQYEGSKCKVFMPGQWAYKVETSQEGMLLEVHGGSGKLLLRIQTIEGKQEATAEKLMAIFEEFIMKGAPHTEEKSEIGLLRRYTPTIDGERALYKGLFVRHEGVGYMVYMQALAEDAEADPGLEKTMDSILASFRPV